VQQAAETYPAEFEDDLYEDELEAPGFIGDSDMKMAQSLDEFELAFAEQAALERQNRRKLRKRTADRSRARKIERAEKSGRVRFSVLFVALTATVIVVTVAMFETLAWLMAP
jgi:hypothetical protein